MATSLSPKQASVLRQAITTARSDAMLFIEKGEFHGPFENRNIPEDQQSLFRSAWYRVYDSILASDERGHSPLQEG